MKSWWRFAAVLCGIAVQSALGLELGKPAPALELSTVLRGTPVEQLGWNDLKGKVVVIDFWATWCGPCVASIPHWNQLAESFRGKPVEFIAITDEAEQLVRTFLRKKPITSTVALDKLTGLTMSAYDIRGLPTTVIVNQQGVVVALTHPARLKAENIEEVLRTEQSSIPSLHQTEAETVPRNASVTAPETTLLYEVSVRTAGELQPGQGFDYWEGSEGTLDVTGRFATVRRAILTLFDTTPSLLELRTELPTALYDFSLKFPPGAAIADREQAARAMLRSLFNLDVRREPVEREVYLMRVVSTNAPGLQPAREGSAGGGGEQPGGVKLGRAKVDWLTGYFEQWLQKPVFNETGLTNRYDIALRWEMSELELLPHALDRTVLEAAYGDDPQPRQSLTERQLKQVRFLKGEAGEEDLIGFSKEEQENLKLFKAEMTKPEDDRFRPRLENIMKAVRDQLGLELIPAKRKLSVLIVEQARTE